LQSLLFKARSDLRRQPEQAVAIQAQISALETEMRQTQIGQRFQVFATLGSGAPTPGSESAKPFARN